MHAEAAIPVVSAPVPHRKRRRAAPFDVNEVVFTQPKPATFVPDGIARKIHRLRIRARRVLAFLTRRAKELRIGLPYAGAVARTRAAAMRARQCNSACCRNQQHDASIYRHQQNAMPVDAKA
ncbi:MAG TPA: hypothetical protein VN707_08105 [Casimicrobiaceae bacterium]|nr:hypothetical protein [Casimicrobiaceae bacterium]